MRCAKHKKLILLLFYVFQAILRTTNIHAATLYVGDDAYQTIPNALSAANPGDVIIVRDGEYHDKVHINKAITIQSEHGKESTEIYDVFEIRSSNVTIDGFTFRPLDTSNGIIIGDDGEPYSDINILNNNFEERKVAIRVENNGCSDIHITDNFIDNCVQNGMALLGNGGFEIIDNTIQLSGWAGIYLGDGTGATIQSNEIISNNGYGIRIIENGPDNTVAIDSANQIVNNTRHGVYIQGTAELKDNSIAENGHGFDEQIFDGVHIEGTATLLGNTINQNTRNGIFVADIAGTVQIVDNNQIINNNERGVLIEGTATLLNNHITGNGIGADVTTFGGVTINGTAVLEGNTIENNGNGISVTETGNSVSITNNNSISNNIETGISISGTGMVTVQGNTINNNREGLLIAGSAAVVDNIINNNNDQAVWMGSSANNVTLDGNTMENNSAGVSVASGATDIILRSNNIKNNDTGVATSSAIKLRGNVIENNMDKGVHIYNSGIDLGQDSDVEAGMNTIRNNANWNVVNFTSDSISAYRNYWGFTNLNDIDATIEDEDEDNSLGPVNFDPFLIEDPTIVGVSSTKTTVLKKTNLISAYPNPFNPRTVINYQLPVNCKVDLSIYNAFGQKVKLLFSESHVTGNYKIEWDATGFASGVYFYRLETDKGFIQTKKLILLK